MSEIKLHRSLRHDNIVRFEHFFEDADNVYILMELCENKTLLDLIIRRKQLHELECQCLIRQICRGLEHIHDNRIVHRDLKLGNLFLNDRMEVKIGDFGLAVKIEYYGQQRNTLCGTPNFLAPEILNMQGEGHSYEVDIWALGVILFAMLIGKPPFEGKDVQSTYGRIKQVRYNFPDKSRLSLQAKDLIEHMLKPDPIDRPTLPEVLQHPWMNSKCGIPESLPTKFLYQAPSNNYIKQFLPKEVGGNMVIKFSGKDYDRVKAKRKRELVLEAPHVQRAANKAHGPRMGTKAYQTMSLKSMAPGGASAAISLSQSLAEPNGEDAAERLEDFGDLEAEEEDDYYEKEI